MSYFIRIRGRSFGPYDESQLLDMKSKGKISGSTEVSYDNEFWFSARMLDWLYPPNPQRSFSAEHSSQPPVEQPYTINQYTQNTLPTGQNANRSSRSGSPPWIFICLGVIIVFILLLSIGLLMPQGGTSDAPAKSGTKSEKEWGRTAKPTGRKLSSEEIVDKYAPSVANIKGKLGGGTGWLIRPNIIATNRHVIEKEIMELTEVTFPSAKPGERGPYQPVLQYIDPKLDLAFLEVKTPLPPLTLAQNYQFKSGRDIVVIGSPGAPTDTGELENAVNKGVLSSQAKVENLNYYQLGISINQGNSGGPAFDMTGSVIGVVTLKSAVAVTGVEGMAFCIPANDVMNSLKAMQKLSSAEKDKFNSKQRAKVLAIWIMMQHQYQDFLLARISSNEVSKNEVVAMLEAHPKIKKVLMSGIFDIEKELMKVVDDSLLDSVTRGDLKEYYHAIQQVDRCFQGKGSGALLRTNTEKASELNPKLRLEFGINEAEVDKLFSVLFL